MASTSPSFHGVLIVLLVSLAANDVAGRNIPTNDKAAANVKQLGQHFDGTMLVLCHGLHWALPERCLKEAHGPITVVGRPNHARMPGYGNGYGNGYGWRHGGGIPAAP